MKCGRVLAHLPCDLSPASNVSDLFVADRIETTLMKRYDRHQAVMMLSSLLACGLIPGRADAPKPDDAHAPKHAAPKSVKPQYSVTDLGELIAVAGDAYPSINNAGHVALWTQTADGTVHAALWADGKMTDLGAPVGYQSSICRYIAPDDTVAGWATTSRNLVDSGATVHAVVFKGGKVTDLGTLGGKTAQAHAIGSAGEVVGVSLLPDGKTRHAFLYRDGKMQDLGTLPGGEFSAAYGINAHGDIAGVASKGVQNHAIVWRGGNIEDLGTFPDGPRSFALGIDDAGTVIGFGETDDGIHAFKSDGPKLMDLGVLGGDPSSARGINAQGDIVGMSAVSSIQTHGFLWRNGVMSDLNDLIPRELAWRLREADSINDRGQIVCVGNHKYQAAHCLLLTPLPTETSRSPEAAAKD